MRAEAKYDSDGFEFDDSPESESVVDLSAGAAGGPSIEEDLTQEEDGNHSVSPHRPGFCTLHYENCCSFLLNRNGSCCSLLLKL